MKKIKIFLASSNELINEREKFELQVYRKCKLWVDKNIFLHLEIWEDLSSRLSETRSQDEYNKKIEDCDLFVLLAYSKVGVYTAEEFKTAFGSFDKRRKPFILTYFKEYKSVADPSLENFKNMLSDLGHFYNPYTEFEELWISFNKELDRMLLTGFEEFNHSQSGQKTINIQDSKNVNTGNVNTGGGNFRIGDG
ncbi:hypothetical protein [Algoriphagus sp.]|uniref:hypothetical protein n=1 Tax=Algoriphagus sp. TaxID=1872435 RepID=UPI0025D3D346|nr:hypothetical protein [Algoriphagus sp.]